MKSLLAVITILLFATSCSTIRPVKKYSDTNFDGSSMIVYRDAESGALLKQIIDSDSKRIVVVYKNR